MVICNRCGNSERFVKHTSTSAGTKRLRCKVCGKVISINASKRQGDYPPCPICKDNSKVIKYGNTLDDSRQRYMCNNNDCNKKTFMRSGDYKQKKLDKKQIVEMWLKFRNDNKYWQITRNASYNDRCKTINGYIADHFNISKRTVSRIISEYFTEHPDPYDRDVLLSIIKRIKKRYDKASNP